MIDSSVKVYVAVSKITTANVEVLLCNMVTYATSSVFAPMISEVGQFMMHMALQPRAAMDYNKANTFFQLENDSICSVPESTGAAVHFGQNVSEVIIGCFYDNSDAQKEIAEWCDIAKVLHDLKGARIGLMVHTKQDIKIRADNKETA